MFRAGPYRIAVLAADSGKADEMAEALARGMTDRVTVGRWGELGPVCDVIVAITPATDELLCDVTRAFRANPHVALVVVAESIDDPMAMAADCMKRGKVVPSNQALDWLVEACPMMARLSQLRSETDEMEGAIPAVPAFTAARRDPIHLPLARAETLFREAYLRLLLSRGWSRAEAARHANVPYRTLCDMVNRLQIESDLDLRAEGDGRLGVDAAAVSRLD